MCVQGKETTTSLQQQTTTHRFQATTHKVPSELIQKRAQASAERNQRVEKIVRVCH